MVMLASSMPISFLHGAAAITPQAVTADSVDRPSLREAAPRDPGGSEKSTWVVVAVEIRILFRGPVVRSVVATTYLLYQPEYFSGSKPRQDKMDCTTAVTRGSRLVEVYSAIKRWSERIRCRGMTGTGLQGTPGLEGN